MTPIFAECEREPSSREIIRAETAAASSLEKLSVGPVLIDSCNPESVWLRTTIDPPENAVIEILMKRWGEEVVIPGWAHRRVLGGTLTFWIWHNGRVRFVKPIGWRAKA